MTGSAATMVTDDEDYGFELVDGELKPMDKARLEAFVQEGVDSARRGELVPHEAVVAKLEAFIAEMRTACGR